VRRDGHLSRRIPVGGHDLNLPRPVGDDKVAFQGRDARDSYRSPDDKRVLEERSMYVPLPASGKEIPELLVLGEDLEIAEDVLA